MTMFEPEVQELGRADLEAWRAACSPADFDRDPFFQSLLRCHTGDGFAALSARLRRVAASAGTALDAAVREAGRDDRLPQLRRHDRFGRPVEEVVFHPSCHEVGRVFWGSGVLSVLAEAGNEVASGAIAYLLDQHGEAGHACPVACTAGAIKLLQRVGTAEQQARWLPGLLAEDYDRRIHAAQFVTEVQGGSDVGRNACVATPAAAPVGAWRISGEKWFCSVADASLFVVSARPEGAPAGTRGLALFLVPRLIAGRPNGFRIRRLKDKLGTRSMATGEIELEGALGEPIGPLADGFRNLVGIVLDTSRVHNAVAACGIMRRALVEGLYFTRHRRAFERPIGEFPAVQGTLARMRLATATALATTFRILAMSDQVDTGGAADTVAAARRIAVMINKYWTAVAATRTVRDGIELLGGNGTIEDFSPLPRLYRDAIVVESWEGTHNTLCAQVLRDFASRGLHRPWLSVLADEIGALGDSAAAAMAGTLHREVSERIERLLAGDELAAAAQVRHVVDRMCRLTDWVALSTQLAREGEQRLAGDTGDLLQLYRLLELERANPQDHPRLVELHQRLAISS